MIGGGSGATPAYRHAAAAAAASSDEHVRAHKRHFITWITIILSLLHIHCAVLALDLQCTDSLTARALDATRSAPSVVLTNWCCPRDFLLNPSITLPNPTEVNYTDEHGEVYSSLPSCGGCPSSSDDLCLPFQKQGGGVTSFTCCPFGTSCNETRQECSGGDEAGGKNLPALNISFNIAAVPVVDMDLCRFTSSGESGSPCAPQFKCEAISQTQFTCRTCADPHYGPEGVCDTFTRPAGRYCISDSIVTLSDFPAASTPSVNGTDEPCPVGFYCPFNSTEPINCTAGQYCADVGLSSPQACNDEGRFYCPDPSRMIACPVGSYCPRSDILAAPLPCPADTYSSEVESSECQPCNSEWVTSDSGAVNCSKLKPLPIILICLGGVLVLAVVFTGSRARKHIHNVRARELEAAELESERSRREAELAAREMMLAIAAADVERRAALEKKEQEALEASRIQFQRDRARIKHLIMDKLDRDLRAALDLRFPQYAAEIISVEQLSDLEEESTPSDHQSKMQEFTLIVHDVIEAEFDSAPALSSALQLLIEKPEEYCLEEFQHAVARVRSLVIEAFQTFQVPKEGAGKEGADGNIIVQVDLDNDWVDDWKNRWSVELLQQVASWAKRSRIKAKGIFDHRYPLLPGPAVAASSSASRSSVVLPRPDTPPLPEINNYSNNVSPSHAVASQVEPPVVRIRLQSESDLVQPGSDLVAAAALEMQVEGEMSPGVAIGSVQLEGLPHAYSNPSPK